MEIILALSSALLFGIGVALQQRAAVQIPVEQAARPSLVLSLARRPIWLAGTAGEIAGFGMQAAALQHGSLIVVQPLLTTSLLFTLAIGAKWAGQPLRPNQWASVGAVLLGLIIFLMAAAPSTTSAAHASAGAWASFAILVVAVAAGSTVVGRRRRGPSRAVLFATAAGVAGAFMAVQAKAFSEQLQRGIPATFGSWQPYTLVAAGIGAMILIQSAYQTGYPTIALPVITVTDPLAAAVVGVAIFGEHIKLSTVRTPVITLAMVIMAAGLIALGRIPWLAGGRGEGAEPLRTSTVT
jgi:drug/metabolite transporter (DMT)-like permease